VSRDTVYAWLGDRRMPGHRAGHKWRFQRDEVDEWLRSGGARSSGTSGQEGSDGR
jgi:excisionase family DNA binding protein